jgi:putative membrane protein
MMYWGNGMGGWGMLVMTVGSVMFWALVIAGGVVLVRYLGARPSDRRLTPEQLLAERFARGEIGEDEYQRRLSILSGIGTGRQPVG